MRPTDLEGLREDLRNFRADLESPEVRAELAEVCLPRVLATLDIIPDAARDKDILELGATPFFLTLSLRRLCTGRIRLGNWFGTDQRHGAQTLTNAKTGEQIAFEYDLFNIETEPFPYGDGSFDVVIFSELLEHLGVNPVLTLSEIHRVLRPGGYMILTTPNAASLDRLETYLRGGSQMVDRYSPLFGPGARHNREYNPRELRALLHGNGFEIEEVRVRDLVQHTRRDRVRRVWWKLLLAWEAIQELHDETGLKAQLVKLLVAWDLLDEQPGRLRDLRRRWTRAYWEKVQAVDADLPREEHIFLRARRSGPFCWRFHPNLFDNIEFYVLVRYPWLAMGLNETIQAGEGWYPPEMQGERVVCRIRGVSQGFLRAPGGRVTLHVELHAPETAAPLSVHVLAWDRWFGRLGSEHVYADAVRPIARAGWQQLDVPLERQPPAGSEVEVRIAVNGDAHAPVPVEEPGEPERNVGICRYWLTAD